MSAGGAVPSSSSHPALESANAGYTGGITVTGSNEELADKMQDAVDRIFGAQGWRFSFSVADPSLDGCPLIACSTGFAELCGYTVSDIVGRNCRFLVASVPPKMVDKEARRQAKDFCAAITRGQPYKSTGECPSWLPEGRPDDEILVMQVNARKDGTLFNNMFYMKSFKLGAELGDERPFIAALQTELEGGKEDLAKIAANLEILDSNMARMKRELASLFFVQSSSINRQDHYTPFPVAEGSAGELYSAFDPSEVKPWVDGAFQHVRRLASATRNKGVVHLVNDTENDNRALAAKQMPNTWVRESHDEFMRLFPDQSEQPWQDIGCTRFLNDRKFEYAVDLVGVYRSEHFTFVMSTFAPDGDLFSACEGMEAPLPSREATMTPIVFDLFRAIRLLHDMHIVHRDISLENVLQMRGPDGKINIKIIDFGSASTGRTFKNAPRGKASYQAPEMHNGGEYDAFLTDSFAAGVTAYALISKDYPWLSTKSGNCKSFEYVKQNGFHDYCGKRRVRGSDKRIADVVSKGLLNLLEGMLQLDPSKRLGLGEKQHNGNRSILDEPWMTAISH